MFHMKNIVPYMKHCFKIQYLLILCIKTKRTNKTCFQKNIALSCQKKIRTQQKIKEKEERKEKKTIKPQRKTTKKIHT